MSEKKMSEIVLEKVWEKQKLEERYVKCRRSTHLARDCRAPLRARTSLYPSHANQKLVQKKKRFDKRDFKIRELGSGEDWGNVRGEPVYGRDVSEHGAILWLGPNCVHVQVREIDHIVVYWDVF